MLRLIQQVFKHTCRSHHKAISEAHSHQIESFGFLVEALLTPMGIQQL